MALGEKRGASTEDSEVVEVETETAIQTFERESMRISTTPAPSNDDLGVVTPKCSNEKIRENHLRPLAVASNENDAGAQANTSMEGDVATELTPESKPTKKHKTYVEVSFEEEAVGRGERKRVTTVSAETFFFFFSLLLRLLFFTESGRSQRDSKFSFVSRITVQCTRVSSFLFPSFLPPFLTLLFLVSDQNSEKLNGNEAQVFEEIEKVCLELAAVEVALRRCSNRSEFFSSPKCKIANQVVQKFLKEYKALTQSKRSLLSKARKLRKSIHTFEGISSALRQQVQYVDFALSVTATVPGIDDLEDDQLRQIFTEVLRLSDNCPTSMMSLSTVCKRWGKLVRSADVWKALHLNKLANSVADHELLVLLGNDKAFSKVSSISLASCVQVTEKSLLPILHCCGANLTYLDISGCWLLTKRTLEIIVECCPKLNHLNMSRCSGIMLEDALDILDGSKLVNSLHYLGIGFMGGVCRRISRASFESIAEKTENFTLKHPKISMGATQLFFRLCMRKLEDIPRNTDQSMCQAPFCSLGDGDDSQSVLQLLQCGHVICLGCENLARGNVRTVRASRGGDSSIRMSSDFDDTSSQNQCMCHLYPCPTCGHDMGPPSPCSKSFSIIV